MAPGTRFVHDTEALFVLGVDLHFLAVKNVSHNVNMASRTRAVKRGVSKRVLCIHIGTFAVQKHESREQACHCGVVQGGAALRILYVNLGPTRDKKLYDRRVFLRIWR